MLSRKHSAATLATITIQYATGYIPVIAHKLSLLVPQVGWDSATMTAVSGTTVINNGPSSGSIGPRHERVLNIRLMPTN